MTNIGNQFDRTGLVLYVLKYEECIAFYRDVLQLDIHFKNDSLTCFKFGESYLMVEIDDEFMGSALQANDRERSCIRLNVANVKAYADDLTSKGVAVDYQKHNWGTVAKFRDPDGNLIAFKDSPKFEEQMNNG